MSHLRLFGLLGALLVAACGFGAAANPDPSESPGPASLDGRTFLSVKVDGHDLVPGTRVRLDFTDGRIGVQAGCNSMSGAYQVADGRLVTGNMATTEMGCEAALLAQDQWVLALLGGASADLAGDTLTVRNGDVTLTLKTREVADPQRPLEGTRWVLDGILAGEAVSTVPGGLTAAITIADGRIAVETGCNTGGGPAAVTPTNLTIGPLTLTKRACEPATAAIEAAVTGVLRGDPSYRIDADRLTLTAGTAGLMFRAAS